MWKHTPLAVQDGLCHMILSKPNCSDLEKLPKIIMTSDVLPWDPGILDIDPFNEYKATRKTQQEFHLDPDFDDDKVDHEVMVEYCVRHAFETMVKRHVPHYDNLCPYLGYIPVEHVKRIPHNGISHPLGYLFGTTSSRVFLPRMSVASMKWSQPTLSSQTYLLLTTVCWTTVVSQWSKSTLGVAQIGHAQDFTGLYLL